MRPPNMTVGPASAAVRGTSPEAGVGETLQGWTRDAGWLARQHERDLAVLGRCEEQMLQDAGDPSVTSHCDKGV